MNKALLVLLLPFIISCSSAKVQNQTNRIDAFNYTSNKVVNVSKAAVVSAHPLASAVGLSVMQQGGNAFDAAIATQLALAVVYPGAGNLGGGGFMVAVRSNGEQLALDYREMAPSSATKDMYLDEDGNVVKGKSVNGHLAGGVPGTVAGLFEILKYAKLPFSKLVQPAIELAERGFVITAREAASLNNIQEDLAAFNTIPSAFHGKWKKGDTLVQSDLAATLRRLAENGSKGFYEGKTADLIVDEMKRGGGIINHDDLKNYKARWRTAQAFSYKGHTVVSMPMPSSGGTLLQQMLGMVESRPLASYGFLSPAAVQLMTEVERRAYADRSLHMGDADFYNVPTAALTSPEYLMKRMSDYRPGLASNSVQVTPGTPIHQSEQTTHLSIIDEKGNAVSVTTTLNNSYGSKTVIGGAGFFLNDEMDDFSAKPGTANIYGAVGGAANAIAPGKRMLSSMTPTIVVKAGKPYLVIGTPGGTTIPTSVFQTIVDIIDFGLTTEQAVNNTKFHHQWLPDELYVERSFPEETKQSLRQMGYKIVERDPIGRTEVIRVLPGGAIEAVADKRGDDSAAGY